jgi:hypothetical protein
MTRSSFPLEGRPVPATRSRLRSGKLLNLDLTLLSECTLYDLENGDIGIVVQDPELPVPDRILIDDHKDLTRVFTEIHWRMGPYLFGMYLEPPVPLHEFQGVQQN